MAAKNIELVFDARQVDRFMTMSEEAINVGIDNGIKKALEYWKLMAMNDAPIGRYKGQRGGYLRTQIDTTPIRGSGFSAEGSVVANAFKNGFNYAYYVHNVATKKGRKARTPGTALNFLETSADKSEARIQAMMLKALEDEAKRRGLN